MNKIEVRDETLEKIIKLNEDTFIFYENCNINVKYEITGDVKVFMYVYNSVINGSYDISSNFSFNVFAVDSSVSLKLDLNREDINLDYVYSTINEHDNSYVITVNHNCKNQISKVINHGINLDSNKLCFVINTVIPKDSIKICANQDSKIILVRDGSGKIDPNLIIDNDDINANHSAYIGDFKEEDIFYIKSRGISLNDARKLLAKAFLIGKMKISYKEINIILEKLDLYWR